MADATRRVARTVRRFNRWVIAGTAAIVLMCGLLLAGQAQQRRASKQGRDILTFLANCTTQSKPGHPHPCYDTSSQRTAQFLTRQNFEVVFAAECARRADLTDPQIESCIKSKLMAVGQSAFP